MAQLEFDQGVFPVFQMEDAAAFKHDVCIYDTLSAKVVRRMRIENKTEDYEALLQAIKEAWAKENAEVRLGVESTGSYSRAIVEWFAREKWIRVYHANPILTSTYQQCSKVHYAKNDRIDAEGIAKFLAAGTGLVPYAPLSYRQKQARETYREIVHLSDDITDTSNRLGSPIHEYFPEFLGVFGCIRSPLPLWILSNYDLESIPDKGKRDNLRFALSFLSPPSQAKTMYKGMVRILLSSS